MATPYDVFDQVAVLGALLLILLLFRPFVEGHRKDEVPGPPPAPSVDDDPPPPAQLKADPTVPVPAAPVAPAVVAAPPTAARPPVHVQPPVPDQIATPPPRLHVTASGVLAGTTLLGLAALIAGAITRRRRTP